MLRLNPTITGLLLLLMTTHLSAAYVTDKLLAGIYDEPDTNSKPTRVLPSGTPLEPLENKDDLTLVRLSDRTEGWMETRLISHEKPAQVMLLELQASTSELRLKLIQTEATLKQSTASVPEEDSLKNELADANERILGLSKELEDETNKLAQEGGFFALPIWLLPTALLLMIASFSGGIIFRNYRLRKRLGGLRL
ncbi:hypothetical protein MNBD_GAMMA26-479 [hydrothermal vent metagenome]|uniref:SH3b domain-containing protein n=1 Tax=hydrothermal vent metagenome TaxID=652676 RepID=A0A3B1ALG1_9ZZZZ